MNADARKVMRRQAALSVESMGENARALLFSAHVLEALDEIDRLESKIEKLVAAGDRLTRKFGNPGGDARMEALEAWDRAKGEDEGK